MTCNQCVFNIRSTCALQQVTFKKRKIFFLWRGGGGCEEGRVSLAGLGDELHSKLMKTQLLIKFGVILYYARCALVPPTAISRMPPNSPQRNKQHPEKRPQRRLGECRTNVEWTAPSRDPATALTLLSGCYSPEQNPFGL